MVPRFAYTIGLSSSLGAELLLCGGAYYSSRQVGEILNRVAQELRSLGGNGISAVRVDDLGSFSLGRVDNSWTRHLLLGAFDFLGTQTIEARQVKPDAEHWTLDVPDTSKPWDQELEPVWASLAGAWDFSVSPSAMAVTNLAALRGERVTEAARWEDGQWELFAGPGPEVQQQDMRVVPLGTLLGHDRTLLPVTKLQVGAALWRKADSLDWQPWTSSR